MFQMIRPAPSSAYNPTDRRRNPPD